MKKKMEIFRSKYQSKKLNENRLFAIFYRVQRRPVLLYGSRFLIFGATVKDYTSVWMIIAVVCKHLLYFIFCGEALIFWFQTRCVEESPPLSTDFPSVETMKQKQKCTYVSPLSWPFVFIFGLLLEQYLIYSKTLVPKLNSTVFSSKNKF